MKHFGDNVVTLLKNTVTQLEELQVQTALGKSDFTDKLENFKKETRHKFSQAKADLNAFADNRKDSLVHFKAKLQHLEVQLALAKAETAEEFNRQKKNISAAIRDVKEMLAKA